MACWFLKIDWSIIDVSCTFVEAVSTIICMSSATTLKFCGKSRMKSTSFFAWCRPCFRCCTRGSCPSSCSGTRPPRRDSACSSSMRSACIFSFAPVGFSILSGSIRSVSRSSCSRIASASGNAACAPGCSFTVHPPVRLSGVSSKTSSYCLRMSRRRMFLNMLSFFNCATLKSDPIWESVTDCPPACPPCISKALNNALAISDSFRRSASLATAIAGVQMRSRYW
mmetsp:Transcript_78968/g.218557  ORF Transcript_78968/g.218557 Transcript_78968/m.218557 type:complete len:225 (-) Transcript_78968:834-1508(-)